MRQHGTHACYVFGPEPGGDTSKGCRCDLCREAATVANRRRRRSVAPAYVGAAAVRDHINFLRSRGLGVKTIAARAGVPHGAISKIVYGDYKGRGPSKRVRVETRDRILAVQPGDAADGAKVDATRTWEHIDTLLERGWTKAAIARGIGQTGQALQLSRHLVAARNARAVAALLDQPVPPRRSRHGIHPVEQPVEPETLPVAPPPLPRINLGDTAWRAQSACRLPNVPAWIFFPGRGGTETTTAAVAVCERCPVRDDCLESHLTEKFGIWGGTTENERRRIRRERGIDDDQDESEAA